MKIDDGFTGIPPAGFASKDNPAILKKEEGKIVHEQKTTLYNVIDAFPINIPAPTGICSDGKYFWIPNYAAFSGNQMIYKFDIQTKRIIDSIPSPSPWASGMAWDGTGIWLKGGTYQNVESGLIKISTKGVVDTFFNSVYSCYWGGVAWDGTNLYYGINTCGVAQSRESSMIYKIAQKGIVLDSFPPPSGNINGLVFDKNHFWYCDAGSLKIYKMTINGVAVDSFAAPGPLPSGLAVAQGYLWNVDVGSNRIYQIDIGLAPYSPYIIDIKSRYSSAILRWRTNQLDSDLVSFRIYRDTLDNPLTAIYVDSVPASVLTYTDRSVANGKGYYYWVSAVDSNGYESHLYGGTNIYVDLPIPGNWNRKEDTGKVRLEWEDMSHEGAFYYRLYRSQDIFSIRDLYDSVFIPEHSYVDTVFPRSGWYFYGLSTVDSNGNESNLWVLMSGKPILPVEITLRQNYPNPFNGNTVIGYEVPFPVTGRLDIFNMLGQVVKSFQVHHELSGYYSVVWDAYNISSGVYFYRLQVGNSVATKKLIIIR